MFLQNNSPVACFKSNPKQQTKKQTKNKQKHTYIYTYIKSPARKPHQLTCYHKKAKRKTTNITSTKSKTKTTINSPVNKEKKHKPNKKNIKKKKKNLSFGISSCSTCLRLQGLLFLFDSPIGSCLWTQKLPGASCWGAFWRLANRRKQAKDTPWRVLVLIFTCIFFFNWLIYP